MYIAIPVWEGKVSPVFDTASRLFILNTEGKEKSSSFEVPIEEQDISRRSVRVKKLGVDILICGAISRPLQKMLMAGGVEVIPWISGRSEDVLEAYLKGDLFNSKFLMPGCSPERNSREKGE